ncbi:hypothetical protein GGI19_001580 [Coemansia pectinata]|uniref:Uncharacterized protein n=1 Tax=Coemansia pectinata TaxID=1052879 RepID=A0A9W8GYQ1_9FUNG|nr:hypothetical protein GGI19_001580 [Coemansia pectinata]
MSDERDENFREMAALGNVKAVRAYIRGGVNIDGQNKMNGWTALHWACARGQSDIVEILIRAGANLDLKNSKGESALDVCKSDNIRALFPGHEGASNSPATSAEDKPVGDSTEKAFVPNYLANPDLIKAWGMPDDVLDAAVTQGESGYMRQMQYEASVSGGNNSRQQQQHQMPQKSQTSAPAPVSDERELLVYRNQVDESSLLGSVFISDNRQTVAELGDIIREELDGVPETFTVARYNGKQTVPVSTKQETFNVGRIFRGTDDAVVLK